MRSSTQALLRASSRTAGQAVPRTTRTQLSRTSRRYASNVPADKPHSWKSRFLRLGLAGAAVYYYNTSSLFADQPGFDPKASPQTTLGDGPVQTFESITTKKRERTAAEAKAAASKAQQDAAAGLSPEELEQEAGQEGAFNPETGEINWDCPCLGGMAHGPCGEQFKAAFSCFVFSKEEPKGVDCIDKFKGMQDCFREHPDIYGAELESYDDDDEELDAGIESRPPGDVGASDLKESISTEAASLAGRAKKVADEKIPELKAQAKKAVNKGKDTVDKGREAVVTKASESKRQAQNTLEKGKAAVQERVPEVKTKVQSAIAQGRSAVEETQAAIREKVPALASSAKSTLEETGTKVKETISLDRAKTSEEARSRALAAKKQVEKDIAGALAESEEVVPKKWHDQREANSKI